MAMDGKAMATEILKAMGGTVDDVRQAAFEAFCTALVAHLQANAEFVAGAVMPGMTTSAGGGAVTGTLTVTKGGLK